MPDVRAMMIYDWYNWEFCCDIGRFCSLEKRTCIGIAIIISGIPKVVIPFISIARRYAAQH